MNDEELKSRLQRAHLESSDSAPAFDSVWQAAEVRVHRRTRLPAIAAGLGIVAIGAMLLAIFSDGLIGDGNQIAQTPDNAWVEAIDISIMDGTAWLVPSDALLPQEQSEILNTLPPLFESTEMEVEAFL